jgi:hypothetical protein
MGGACSVRVEMRAEFWIESLKGRDSFLGQSPYWRVIELLCFSLWHLWFFPINLLLCRMSLECDPSPPPVHFSLSLTELVMNAYICL